MSMLSPQQGSLVSVSAHQPEQCQQRVTWEAVAGAHEVGVPDGLHHARGGRGHGLLACRLVSHRVCPQPLSSATPASRAVALQTVTIDGTNAGLHDRSFCKVLSGMYAQHRSTGACESERRKGMELTRERPLGRWTL